MHPSQLGVPPVRWTLSSARPSKWVAHFPSPRGHFSLCFVYGVSPFVLEALFPIKHEDLQLGMCTEEVVARLRPRHSRCLAKYRLVYRHRTVPVSSALALRRCLALASLSLPSGIEAARLATCPPLLVISQKNPQLFAENLHCTMVANVPLGA